MKNLRTITLKNSNSMCVEIINFGARIKSIQFPINGTPTEMTVAYPKAEDYLTDEFYLGVTCGRVCNRIENGKFSLDEQSFTLTTNDGENTLHGGVENYAHRFWQVESESSTAVTLSLLSEHGDQGFPGNLSIKVEYSLTEENELMMNYTAKTDAATPINITNHAYFSLGESSGELLDLQVNASSMLERKDNGLPSGKVISVEQTDFDFQQTVNIGQRQQETQDKSLQEMQCYDHCFVLNHNDIGIADAVLTSPNNKVRMTLYTDQLAVQLYTGVALTSPFNPYQGVCLEAQNYTNAINIPHFPNSVLTPESEYKQSIIYHFESIK